ncbi:hypothetical protein DL96DRAFT_768015 [Flagelloscypha sp. PMI_526]|nr:hypothetical protein DL96DRAFT_768015 [Flagelloscypha sp. PMI_526]
MLLLSRSRLMLVKTSAKRRKIKISMMRISKAPSLYTAKHAATLHSACSSEWTSPVSLPELSSPPRVPASVRTSPPIAPPLAPAAYPLGSFSNHMLNASVSSLGSVISQQLSVLCKLSSSFQWMQFWTRQSGIEQKEFRPNSLFPSYLLHLVPRHQHILYLVVRKLDHIPLPGYLHFHLFLGCTVLNYRNKHHLLCHCLLRLCLIYRLLRLEKRILLLKEKGAKL